MKFQNDAFTVIASHLRERSTSGLSHRNIRDQLQAAIEDAHPNEYCYISEIHGDEAAGDVVYSMGSKMKRRKYKISTERGTRKTTLGEPTNVLPRISWDEMEPNEQPMQMESDRGEEKKGRELTESCEQAVFLAEAGPSTRKMVRLIKPGWGSSGFYPAEVLKRDGPKIFPKNTHMFLNHATAAEGAQRPEGDIRKLAAVTAGNAFWDASHKDGPGLFAEADIFSQYAPDLLEKAPFTGVSIKARGYGKDGKAEGKEGFIVSELFLGESVDFVTKAGAGGKVLTESKGLDPRDPGFLVKLEEATRKGPHMDEAAVKALFETEVKPIKEANATLLTENGKLKAQVLKFQQRSMTEDARRIAAAECSVPSLRLTETVQGRIVQRVLVQALPLTEAGELDEVKFKAVVEAEIKDEVKYLAELSDSGQVRGLGESAPIETAELKPEDFHKQMLESAIAEGYTPEQAERFAKGRVN